MARNQTPQLVANGNIPPSVFVKIDTSKNHAVLKNAAATTPSIGISGTSTKAPPGISGSSTNHAEQGDPCEVFSIGDICLLTLGGSVTRGDRLTSDANGAGVTAATTNEYGAIALESGSSGELIRVQVSLGKLP